MSDHRTSATVPLAGSMLDGPDELRRRAARYRLLATTLLNPSVIAVVLDCARDLEMEASAADTAAEAESTTTIRPTARTDS